MYRHWHHHVHQDYPYCRHRVHSACEHPCKGQWQRVPGSLLCGVMAGGGQRVHPSSPAETRRDKSGADAANRQESGATPKVRSACVAETERAPDKCTSPPSQEAGTSTRHSTKDETKNPAGGGATSEQLSPPPSRPSQRLYTTALRETPMFVKHEAIQTCPSKTKTRSAFAVIRTDEKEPSRRSPGTEGDTKSKQPTDQAEDTATKHHHHWHHPHRCFCWAAYHHCRQTCGHAWPGSHLQHESKDDKKDTTCAGFFINVSKDDWGVLLKEAWNRIKGMIRRSGGTILLDHVPSAPTVGENAGHADVTIGESVRWYDAHCAHQSGHQRTQYFSAHPEGCLHAHKCCQHQKTDETFYQPHRYFEGRSPNQVYDCFECCQLSSCTNHTVI